MKSVKYIIFRYLTNAEFFNINKPSGTEESGGGQAYIDFPIISVPISKWDMFFSNSPNVQKSTHARGPSWEFIVQSIGCNKQQKLTIYQRRPQSVCIGSQRITSPRENRVKAWHPENGFPVPDDSMNRKALPPNLAVFLIKTYDNQFWAGWFQKEIPTKDTKSVSRILYMLNNSGEEGFAGFLEYEKDILFIDKSDKNHPFYSTRISAKKEEKRKVLDQQKEINKQEEQDITQKLFKEDQKKYLDTSTKEIIKRVRKRNIQAIKDLKILYGGKCQITNEHSFLKKDGTMYSEGHHLIPLGEKGADDPYNIIIVSPLIHRMLHYADVGKIDLSKISKVNNTLPVIINGKKYTIKWHPGHAKYVRRYQAKKIK